MIDTPDTRDTGTSSNINDRASLLALLEWYRATGVDDAIDEISVDWLSRGPTPPTSVHDLIPDYQSASIQSAPPRVSPQASATRPVTTSVNNASIANPPPASPSNHAPQVPSPLASAPNSALPPNNASSSSAAATNDARTAAKASNTLLELSQQLNAFEGCGLKATAKNLCFYRGAEHARVMVIGEAPGRDEDRAGRPFVGRAGQMLDKMLAAIGLDEAQTHITNVVYWRPPGNRTPTPLEIQICRPFLERQVELVAPDIVVTLGGPASKAILETPSGIMKLRGKWCQIQIGDRQMKIMPTLHPAYLLRTPAAKRLAWRDLVAIKAALAQ